MRPTAVVTLEKNSFVKRKHTYYVLDQMIIKPLTTARPA